MYWATGYDASASESARSVSATVTPPMRTVTRVPVGLTVIGWVASGIFTVRFIRKPLPLLALPLGCLVRGNHRAAGGHSATGSLALDRPVCFNGAIDRRTGLPNPWESR